MDEIEGALQALLRSPETMQKLQGILHAVGESPSDPADAPTPAPAAPAAPPPAPTPAPAVPPDLAKTVATLAPLLGSLGGETEDTALLRALRPFVHGEREKRLEQALRVMQMAQLLPLLQQAPKGE